MKRGRIANILDEASQTGNIFSWLCEQRVANEHPLLGGIVAVTSIIFDPVENLEGLHLLYGFSNAPFVSMKLPEMEPTNFLQDELFFMLSFSGDIF